MKKIIVLCILLFSVLSAGILHAQNNTPPESFKNLNKKNRYTSFYFGMGASVGNNSSLIDYISGDIPFYNTIATSEQLSNFSEGLEFFGGAEFQLSKNFSIKPQYSYFIKSFSVSQFSAYDYSYYNHQPYIIFNYVAPQDYSFFKVGAGIGYIISKFTRKEFGSETQYSSSGIGLMTEGVLNLQISGNLGGYIGGYISQTINGDLEDDNGNKLTNVNGDNVNLNSLTIGLRLGIEIFIF